MRCSVNGEMRQDGSTAEMTYAIPFIVEYLSEFATLRPGDLVLTGSPGGSGALLPGDRVDIDIEGVGVLSHFVVGADRQ